MTDKQLKEIDCILSKYYHDLSVKKIPAKKKMVKEIEIVKEPEAVPVQIDEGSEPLGWVVIFVGILVGIVLLADSRVWGIATIAICFLLGLVLIKKLRKISIEEKTVLKDVKRTVEKEIIIEPEKIVEISNNERVTKFSKGYIPLNAIPFRNKSILTYNCNCEKKNSVKFPSLEDFRKVYALDTEMEALSKKVPYVLVGENKKFSLSEESSYGEEISVRGYEKEILDKTKEIRKECEKAKQIEISFTTLDEESIYPELIRISEEFSNNGNNLLLHYLESEEGYRLEETLTNWYKKWEINSNVLGAIRFESLNDHVGKTNYELGNAMQYTAFNFYCPKCNKEKIEEFLERDYSLQSDSFHEPLDFPDTTQCNYILNTDMWVCKTCESDFEKPIPVHKSFDEILLPVYLRLMEENKNERFKVHKETKQKEIEYENLMEAEIEKAGYDNLSAIYGFQEEMERIRSEVSGETEAINSFKDIVAFYSEKQSLVIENISRYCFEINKEVDEQTERVIRETDEIKEREMKQLYRDLTNFAIAKKKEEEARDQIQKNILGNTEKLINVTKEGFENVNKNLDKIDDTLEKGNEIAKEGNRINKDGLNRVGKAVEQGSDRIAKQISKGNALSAAVAKNQGIDLHDESWWRIDKKSKNGLIDALGGLLGESTMEKEGRKLNG